MTTNKDAEVAIGYPESLLWSELKTCSTMLEDQDDRIEALAKEMSGRTADGEWLDYWMMNQFGVARLDGETDLQYYTRAKHEILSKRGNNKALEQLVYDALGVKVTIADAYPVAPSAATKARFYLDMVLPTIPRNAGESDVDYATRSEVEAQKLVVKVKGVVSRSRAAGTFFVERGFAKQPDIAIEIVTADEALFLTVKGKFTESLLDGYIKLGGYWKTGAVGLKLGINYAIKEQVSVKVVKVADGTTQSQAFYGG